MANFLQVPGVKADVSAMIEIAGKLGIELPKGRSAAKIAPALRAAFSERLKSIPEDDWIKCEKCGEVTDDAHEIDRCPYCGDLGEAPSDDDSDDDDSDLAEDVNDTELSDALAEDAIEMESEDDADVEEPPTVDVSASDDSGDDAGDDSGDDSAVLVAAGGAELVAASEAELADLDTLAQLETEKRIITEASRDIRRKAYELGKSLKRVFDGELWRGEGHSGFNKFLASIDVDSSMAYKLMQVVTEFSESQVLEVGWTKLSIVARLPAGEQREQATERARASSRSQLEAEVRGEPVAPPPKERDVKDAPVALDPLNDGFVKGRPRKQDQEITLLTKVGGKAESHHFIDCNTGKQVNKWHEDTFGEIRISDNVSLFIALRAGNNGAIKGFTTAFRRVELSETVDMDDADADEVAAE